MPCGAAGVDPYGKAAETPHEIVSFTSEAPQVVTDPPACAAAGVDPYDKAAEAPREIVSFTLVKPVTFRDVFREPWTLNPVLLCCSRSGPIRQGSGGTPQDRVLHLKQSYPRPPDDTDPPACAAAGVDPYDKAAEAPHEIVSFTSVTSLTSTEHSGFRQGL